MTLRNLETARAYYREWHQRAIGVDDVDARIMADITAAAVRELDEAIRDKHRAMSVHGQREYARGAA